MNKIGDRLKQLIEDKGLTPYKVSKRIQVSQATLSRIINKNSTPNESNTKAIVEFFGVSESWLLTGEGDMFVSGIVNETLGTYEKVDCDDLKKDIVHLEQLNSQLTESNQNLKKMISILEEKVKDLKNQNSNFQKNH